MTVATLMPAPDPARRRAPRAARRQEPILTELERRGLARPAPRTLVFRIRGVDPEEADRAVAADFPRARDAGRDSLDSEPT
jgi:hypothetical protein